MLFSTRILPSSPSSSMPAVSMSTTGPMPPISMLLRTGSVVVPAVSLTMAVCCPVRKFTMVLLPTLRRPKRPILGFSSLPFITVIIYLRFTTVMPSPPSSSFSGWKVRTSREACSSWRITCISMP